MLALSVIGILGCGGNNVSTNHADNILLTEKAVVAAVPVLIGFNTAIPSTVKPGDAVGHVASAYNAGLNPSTLGTISYSLSGSDADKFIIDEIGFIRALHTLENNKGYTLKLTADNNMGSSIPVTITINNGQLYANPIKDSRCINCQPNKPPVVTCATMYNTIHINENSTYVSTITSSLGNKFAIESGIDMDKFEFIDDTLKFIKAPDFENPTSAGSANEYLVNVTDQGMSRQELKIIVDNTPDTVPKLTAYSTSLPETTPANTYVGNVGTLLEGEENIRFIVLKDASNTSVKNLNFYIDIFGNIYTNKDMHGLIGDHKMIATAYNESGWSDSVIVAINVADRQVDDALINPLLADIDENSEGGTKVGKIRIPDLGDLNLAHIDQIDLVSYDYDWAAESPNTSPFELAIEGDALWLKVKATYAAYKLDYEQVTFYTLKIQLHDTVAGLSTNRVCAYIQINDIDE
jgi:hypothetical protein